MRTTKTIKKVYLSSTWEEINFSKLKAWEEVKCRIYSLSYFSWRGYSLWIIPKVTIEATDYWLIEKFWLMDWEIRRVLNCERASKARETEAIEILNKIIQEEKNKTKIPNIVFELNPPEEEDWITETFSKEFKFTTLWVQELLWDYSEEYSRFIFKTLEEKAKVQPLDYLQKLKINWETVWAIDDWHWVTLLLPSEY